MNNADVRQAVAKSLDQLAQQDAKAIALHMNNSAGAIGNHEDLAAAYETARPLIIYIAKNLPANTLEYQAMADLIQHADAELGVEEVVVKPAKPAKKSAAKKD